MFRRVAVALASLSLSIAVYAQSSSRTYAGGFTSNWKTVGHHGHDQPLCNDIMELRRDGVIMIVFPDCNPVDFARGNLDNSIGFRAGRERDYFSAGPLRLLAGVEGSVSYTEYNLTQSDFSLLSGVAFAGADLQIFGVRAGVRYGAGPFATNDWNESGVVGYSEYGVTLPLRPGAALRITQRNTESLYRSGSHPSPQENPRSPEAVETSILFVASPDITGSSAWEFSTSTGSTDPGAGFGGDRVLRSSVFTRFEATRDLPWRGLQLETTWVSAGHESKRPTKFLGYDNNFRSKTIDGFGLGLRRTKQLTERLSVRYGAGFEVADWRDEHQLLTRDGKELVAGIEGAIAMRGAVRFHLTRYFALVGSAEKVYWPAIDLSELRTGFGIALTR